LKFIVMSLPACHSVYAKILDHMQRPFGDYYLATKFRADSTCRFEIITNLIFRLFGLKKPTHSPKWGVLWSNVNNTPKGTSWRDSGSF